MILRFPGQVADAHSALYYNYFRDYDPETGRYVESDPIGLLGGKNTYTYVRGSVLRFIDPKGLDIAVIENGATDGNPIGHTAIAITGAGVYSFGNTTAAGSSLKEYVLRESPRRNSKIYIVKTTPEQDTAALNYLNSHSDTKLPSDFASIAYADNCSTRSNAALSAAGIPYPYEVDMATGLPLVILPSQPGSAGYRAISNGAIEVSVPRDTQHIPAELDQFEPK